MVVNDNMTTHVEAPTLKVCVAMSNYFTYLVKIQIRGEGNETNPTNDVILQVEYRVVKLKCRICKGFGHGS